MKRSCLWWEGYPGSRVDFELVFTRRKKVVPLWFDFWGNWEELLFPCRTFSYRCNLSGLKSTELNSDGHLYCFKQLIGDSIIVEVKARLLSWDFADDFDSDLAFAAILDIAKFAHTHCISSCPSLASQRDKVFIWQKIVSHPGATLPCRASNPIPRDTLSL